MLPDSLLDDVGDVLERWRQLLELVVAQGNVVSDVALVASRVESLLELALCFLILLLLVEDATLGDNSLGTVRGHLRDERLGVGHLFELILDVSLKLQDLLSVLGVLNLLGNLGSFLIHASLEETLGMVKLVARDIRVELGKLIILISSISIVLNIEVAMSEE